MANKANICIDCKKACGKCSWSACDPVTGRLLFEPVPGWTAEPVLQNIGHHKNKMRKQLTYSITACPLFEPEAPRKQNYRELSEAENKWFLENVERILREWDDGRG